MSSTTESHSQFYHPISEPLFDLAMLLLNHFITSGSYKGFPYKTKAGDLLFHPLFFYSFFITYHLLSCVCIHLFQLVFMALSRPSFYYGADWQGKGWCLLPTVWGPVFSLWVKWCGGGGLDFSPLCDPMTGGRGRELQCRMQPWFTPVLISILSFCSVLHKLHVTWLVLERPPQTFSEDWGVVGGW